MDSKSIAKTMVLSNNSYRSKQVRVCGLFVLAIMFFIPQLISAKALSKFNDDDQNRVDIVGADEAEFSSNSDAISREDSVANGVQRKSAAWRFSNTQVCNIYENEPLHALMDRICELCHEMFSHEKPNMRVECRADCFRSDDFKRCLRLFKPITHQIRRQSRTKHRTSKST